MRPSKHHQALKKKSVAENRKFDPCPVRRNCICCDQWHTLTILVCSFWDECQRTSFSEFKAVVGAESWEWKYVFVSEFAQALKFLNAVGIRKAFNNALSFLNFEKFRSTWFMPRKQGYISTRSASRREQRKTEGMCDQNPKRQLSGTRVLGEPLSL